MTSRKKVLVIGGEFTNQGAFLMLAAVAARLDAASIDMVLDYRVGTADQKKSLGASSLVPVRIENVFMLPVVGAVFGRLSQRWVSPRDITAVLDVSGFRYGDQWESLDLMESATRLQRWRAWGKTVVFMPQAFGPFAKTADAALVALDAASVVMPRDPDSLAHVSDLAAANGRQWRVVEYPDFTGSMRGGEATRYGPARELLQDALAIVPNWNLAERAEGRGHYLDALEAMTLTARDRGLRVVGVCHEGDRDAGILAQLQRRVGDLHVIRGLNGLELKEVLGGAAVLVSARYHATASALSMGVPTLVQSWSHKYKWLAHEYGMDEWLVSPNASPAEQAARLGALLDSRESVLEHIAEGGVEMLASNDRMWHEVLDEIRHPSGARV